MSDMKRTLRLAAWKIMAIVSFAMWCLLMYFDPVHLSQESFFTRQWFVFGLIAGAGIFLTSIFFWTAKIKSAKVVHCQGNDTWDPSEWYDIPEEKEDGKVVLPALKICGVGGYKALSVYMGGKGEKGWHVVVDVPGIWYRLGANLVLNTDTRETFIGKYEHDEIYSIIDRMNKYILGIPGLITIADDTPIYVYAIPRNYPTISEKFIEKLASLKLAEKYFSNALAQERKENKVIRMKLDRERSQSVGYKNFDTLLKVKGREPNEVEDNERQQ